MRYIQQLNKIAKKDNDLNSYQKLGLFASGLGGLAGFAYINSEPFLKKITIPRALAYLGVPLALAIGGGAIWRKYGGRENE